MHYHTEYERNVEIERAINFFLAYKSPARMHNFICTLGYYFPTINELIEYCSIYKLWLYNISKNNQIYANIVADWTISNETRRTAFIKMITNFCRNEKYHCNDTIRKKVHEAYNRITSNINYFFPLYKFDGSPFQFYFEYIHCMFQFNERNIYDICGKIIYNIDNIDLNMYAKSKNDAVKIMYIEEIILNYINSIKDKNSNYQLLWHLSSYLSTQDEYSSFCYKYKLWIYNVDPYSKKYVYLVPSCSLSCESRRNGFIEFLKNFFWRMVCNNIDKTSTFSYCYNKIMNNVEGYFPLYEFNSTSYEYKFEYNPNFACKFQETDIRNVCGARLFDEEYKSFVL